MFEFHSAVGSLRALLLKFCKIKIGYYLQYNFNSHTKQSYTFFCYYVYSEDKSITEL